MMKLHSKTHTPALTKPGARSVACGGSGRGGSRQLEEPGLTMRDPAGTVGERALRWLSTIRGRAGAFFMTPPAAETLVPPSIRAVTRCADGPRRRRFNRRLGQSPGTRFWTAPAFLARIAAAGALAAATMAGCSQDDSGSPVTPHPDPSASAASAGAAGATQAGSTTGSGSQAAQPASQVAGLIAAQMEEVALTATLAAPSSHDGTPFNVQLVLSEPIRVSFRRVRDHAFTVTGGEITAASRLDKVRSESGKWVASQWRLGVQPSGANDDVTLSAPGNRPCNEHGALCTEDRRSLSHSLSVTIPAATDRSSPEFEDDIGCNRHDSRSMSVGDSESGTLEQGGDCDWFNVWVDYDERYKVTLAGLGTSRSLRFIRGSDRSVIPGTQTLIESDANQTQMHFTPDYHGRLYVEVSSSSSETGAYTLSIEDDPEMVWSGSEPPDLPGDTTTWAVVEVGDTVNGRYKCHDTDWYKIVLDANESAQVDLSPVTNSDTERRLLDPVLRILDADGDLLEVGGEYVFDDDSGGGVGGKDARVTISAGSSAVTRYIEAAFGRLIQEGDPLEYTGEVDLSAFCGRYVLNVS